MRHANNLESVLTYEGTTEIHTLILGEALTGERALRVSRVGRGDRRRQGHRPGGRGAPSRRTATGSSRSGATPRRSARWASARRRRPGRRDAHLRRRRRGAGRRRLRRQVGAVDVLVNNAGVAESAPLARTTLESWQRHLAVNATGAFLCTRAVLDGDARARRGAIVTVASTAGPRRHALHGRLHGVQARRRRAHARGRRRGCGYAGHGRTRSAPPSSTTEMTARSVASIIARDGPRRGRRARPRWRAASPLGRLLDPQEVAAASFWLASPDAASINGQTLVLDGGGIQS